MERWFNSSQYLAFAIITRSAGGLSTLGAGYIIQDIAKDADRREPTSNRIMLFMSICDFVAMFFAAVIGPAMVPEWTGVPGAAGNRLTCNLQGFIVCVFALSSVMYNVSLALCYLLIVRYKYSNEQMKGIEPYFLYLPITTCFLIFIVGWPFGIYNFDGTYNCYIDAPPVNCDQSDFPNECERGELIFYWNYIGSGIVVIGSLVIITCMVKMYTTVLHHERRSTQHRFILRSTNQRRDLSNMMRSQGLWYSGAFLFTFCPQLFVLLNVGHSQWTLFLFIVLPVNLMGLTNAVIYTRPRFVRFRRKYPYVSTMSSVWNVLSRTSPNPPSREDVTVRSTTRLEDDLSTIVVYDSVVPGADLSPTATSSLFAVVSIEPSSDSSSNRL